MQLIEKLFFKRCEECGQIIKGESFPGLGPGRMCETCKRKLDGVHKAQEAQEAAQPEESDPETLRQVIDRVKKDFPPEDFDEVLVILSEFGKARFEKGNPAFMRLAILRLANGDKRTLPGLVKMAKEHRTFILVMVHAMYGRNWQKEFADA